MADTLKKPPVDIAIVGFGWTGAILASELGATGLNILALERGEDRDTHPDFEYPRIIDELSYGIRGKLFQQLARETVTVRHAPRATRQATRPCPTASTAPSCWATAWAARACTGTATTGARCRPT